MTPESDGYGQEPRSLPLILAREFAANLATPMFLLDEGGILAYFNEAAELMLGKTYSEVGAITANDFGEMLNLHDLDGSPLRKRDSPSGIAFIQHQPAHRKLIINALDGTPRTIEVTAYPLFGRTGEVHGVLSVFWEATE